MTVDTCVALCDSKNYIYAGVEYSQVRPSSQSFFWDTDMLFLIDRSAVSVVPFTCRAPVSQSSNKGLPNLGSIQTATTASRTVELPQPVDATCNVPVCALSVNVSDI